MTIELESKVSSLLEGIASRLDISPTKYKQAVDRYTAVSSWIAEGDFEGVEDIHFYPQGSFRLGTVVRPIRNGQDADYDIDLVSEFQISKNNTTPQELKEAVGARIAENETYKRMLDKEGRRCWTLLYAEQDGIGFHLDVLPATPEESSLRNGLIDSRIAEKAIAITHKNKDQTYEWYSSNPSGYGDWFDNINKPVFDVVKSAQQRSLFENNREIYASIDEVPEALIKTPLQRAIQILKRHRDVRFTNHSIAADKPISMIITTLAAKLYSGEQNVFITLRKIVTQLDALSDLLKPGFSLNKSLQGQELITRNPDGIWLIPNPVNPNENFADRWHENNHQKAEAFFQWTKWVKEDIIDILGTGDVGKIVKSFESTFGQASIATARALGLPTSAAVVSAPMVHISNPNKPWGM
ncbi:nucleotidyltransferase domain-containing protein [Paenibacillus ehimensis]|uniref:Cyclic GMP-AMP synthase n=1 Tax=Paenibacillus ehimensis TaxID=79264 RepID=A0ABT8VC43_9BACL|nr:nucleotidyltransferase [Paenibacillus ehimensis]MDO3678552.1 nucleotidyltransferase [Paenibacillus ehimensis]